MSTAYGWIEGNIHVLSLNKRDPEHSKHDQNGYQHYVSTRSDGQYYGQMYLKTTHILLKA